MELNHRRYLAGTSALAMLMVASPAMAQQAGPQAAAPADAQDGNADIIVTATRREERLQNVPIAVTAFSAETIQAVSAQTVGDLSAFTPNLSRTSGPTGGNDAFFFIRGIGQLDSNPAADPGVGVYVDGIYMGRVQGSSVDTADVARVEVLRGPQGTLFGRNTIGGAISITTRDPGTEFALQARGTFGSRNRVDGYVGVDIPATDTFRLRVSAATRNQDGWGRNVYTGQTFSDVHNMQGRVRALWEPSADIRLALTADVMSGRGTTAHTVLIGFNRLAGPIPGTTPLGVPFPPDLLADTSTNIDRNFSSVEPRDDLDSWGTSGDLQWRIGGGDITARVIVAYRELKQFVNNDFDATGYRFYENFFDTSTKQLSGELQLSGHHLNDRLTWLLGLYGFHEDIDNNNSICLGGNLGGPFAFARNQGGCIRNNQVFTLGVRSWAAFAHTTFEIVDGLTLTLGGRYTHEEKQQDFNFFIDNRAGVFNFFGIPPVVIPTLSPNNPFLGIPTNYNGRWSEFTPRVGLDYRVNPNVLVYGSWSRGFKSGGFNGRPSPNATGGFNVIQPYDPERLDAYEVGIKSDLFNNRLRLNAAAFYSIYNGIQLLVVDPASGFFNTANAGRNEIKGFEVEATARPTRGLTLYANAGYLDNHYTYINPTSGISPNAKLPLAPEWTISAGLSYRFDLQTHGSLTVRGDYSYRGSVWYGAQNNALERQAPINLVNLRATWTDARERYSLSVFGTNVFNERYYSNTQDVTAQLGVAFAQVAAPGEWGVEFGLRF